MYKKSIILMIAGLLLMSGTGLTLCAQDYIAPEVEISKEKIKIDGKIFLSHVVKEKQTLYSISKAYSTSIEDLYRYNPKLREEGLKKNSILLIPFIEKKEEEKTVAAQTAVPEKKVQKPEVKKESEKRERRRQDRDDFKKMKTHVVKWYEDIKSIAKKYSVSVEAIMETNNLVDSRLTARQKLAIPAPGTGLKDKDAEGTPEKTQLPEKDSAAEALKDNAIGIPDDGETVQQEKKKRRPLFIFPKTNINVAMFLPLQVKEGKASRNFMDFYSGSLLAVRDLSKEGIKTAVKIFDTSNENIIALDREISKADMIIGPVDAEQLATLYTINNDHIPVISPLDPRTEKLAQTYDNFIFAPASHNKQYVDLCQWISEDYIPENHVIVIFEKDGYKTNHHPTVFSALQERGVKYTEFAYNILEGRSIQESLEARMTTTSTNRIVIASESEAFVNDIVRNVNLLTLKNLDIVLYAAGKIRSFETIETEYLHNTNLHTTLSYNTDYDSAEVMEFLKEYRSLYNTEPSQFAFQGYDITKYFVNMYSKYGNYWLDCITGESVPMLQSSFQFEKTGTNAYVNKATRRVIYEKDFVIRDNVSSKACGHWRQQHPSVRNR